MMKPTKLMRQMKALLPSNSRPCTTFMAMFLLRLPFEMRDHLVAQDFTDYTLMAECADLLHSTRVACSFAAVNCDYETAIDTVSGSRRWDFFTQRPPALLP
jgi:hypothetical protein